MCIYIYISEYNKLYNFCCFISTFTLTSFPCCIKYLIEYISIYFKDHSKVKVKQTCERTNDPENFILVYIFVSLCSYSMFYFLFFIFFTPKFTYQLSILLYACGYSRLFYEPIILLL